MFRFMDSFDHYSSNDLIGQGNGQKWTNGTGSYLTTAIISPSGRNLNCLRFNGTANYAATVFKTLDNQASWVIGFAFRFSLLSTGANFVIVSLYDSSTTQCDVRLNSDGTLSVTRANTALTNSLNSTTKSTSTLSINTWYYIEFKATISNSITANTCKVNVNGATYLNISTGQNTRNTINSSANQIYLGITSVPGNAIFSGNNTIDYDDLYILDGTGSVNNDFLGDTRIEARLPVAIGTNTDFPASLSSPLNCVNENTPDGDSTYIYSITTNQISSFLINPTSSVPASIFAQQMIHCSRKTDAGNRQLADLLRSGSTNYPGTTQNLGNNYSYYFTIYENDPNTSAPWTASAANTVEIGVKEIT